MKTVIQHVALATALALSGASASAGVTVTFSQPENYADLAFSQYDREQILRDLTDHFTKLSATLPPGQDLKVEVLDIDLAGRLKHNFRGAHDLRILRGGADWPHMHLRYTLEQDGKVVSTGEEHLSNMMYLGRLNRYSSGDPLRYEKQMIDDWYKKKIAAR